MLVRELGRGFLAPAPAAGCQSLEGREGQVEIRGCDPAHEGGNGELRQTFFVCDPVNLISEPDMCIAGETERASFLDAFGFCCRFHHLVKTSLGVSFEHERVDLSLVRVVVCSSLVCVFPFFLVWGIRDVTKVFVLYLVASY